jgi:C4-type Zn-finger protein
LLTLIEGGLQQVKAKNEAMAKKLKDDQKKRANDLAEYLNNERLLQRI